MALRLVGSTSRNGLSVEQVGGNDVYHMLPQIQTILEQERCSAGYVFGEPQDAGRSIDWYAEAASSVVPFGRLSDSEQLELLQQLQTEREKLQRCAANLRKRGPSGSTYADVIAKALVYPENRTSELIYSVDGKPVMTGWGFSDGSNRTVDGIQELIREVQKKVAAAPPQPLVDPQPEVAEPQPQVVAPDPAVEPHPAAQPVAQPAPPMQQPVYQEPQRPPKNSHWLTWLLLLLLLICVGLAAWYFFFRGPENFNGTLHSRAAMVNEQNEPVDLTLDFSRGDGSGIVTIVSPSKTCRGAASSTLDGDYVVISITGVPCPDGNNFDAILFRCRRAGGSCEATGSDGSTWPVQMN